MKNQNFEWLNEDICKEYQKRASLLNPNNGLDTGAWRSLRVELQEKCNLPEVVAINILNGIHVKDYCTYYGILSGAIPMPDAMKKKMEKDINKKSKEEIIREYEDKIADLESLKHSSWSSFGFEEKD